MVPQFGYGLLIIVVLFVLHVPLVDDPANHADHIPEEGSPAQLDDHHYDHFCIILRSDVSEPHGYGCGHRPVYRVDVLDHQRFVGEGEVGQIDPSVAALRLHVNSRV